MQTFLPLASYSNTAKALDQRRLGKQRLESFQILRALVYDEGSWRNHPATRMWESYEKSLVLYGCAMCLEWRARGYKDVMEQRILDLAERISPSDGEITHPWWLGVEEFHQSHIDSLISKNSDHYAHLQSEGKPRFFRKRQSTMWPIAANQVESFDISKTMMSVTTNTGKRVQGTLYDTSDNEHLVVRSRDRHDNQVSYLIQHTRDYWLQRMDTVDAGRP